MYVCLLLSCQDIKSQDKLGPSSHFSTMQEEKSDIPFPYFAQVQSSKKPGGQEYICLVDPGSKSESSQAKQHNLCAHQELTFQGMINHLTQKHGLELKPRLDFCATCEHLFFCTLEGVEHYLSHVLDFESFGVLGEDQTITADTSHFLKSFFGEWRQHKRRIMNRLLFGESVHDLTDIDEEDMEDDAGTRETQEATEIEEEEEEEEKRKKIRNKETSMNTSSSSNEDLVIIVE